MARSRVLIAIPVIAIIIVGVLLYVSYVGDAVNPPAVSFVFNLRLQVIGVNSTGAILKSDVLPANNIGNPGGIMGTQRLLQYGVNGFYPLYTRDTSGIIFVRSTVVRNYTLGDFFEVWGEPLGANLTLTYAANFTSTSPPQKSFYWDMCVIKPNSSIEIPTAEWGNHILLGGETVHLVFSKVGCG
jgi:hypothetical protein